MMVAATVQIRTLAYGVQKCIPYFLGVGMIEANKGVNEYEALERMLMGE